MSNILYVYGTLRPDKGETVKVKGKMYDLGWFPGVILGGDEDVVCEKIEVDDWGSIDYYEGFYENNPEGSLYLRVPFEDGFIYEFNQKINDPNAQHVPSGDWLRHKKERRER